MALLPSVFFLSKQEGSKYTKGREKTLSSRANSVGSSFSTSVGIASHSQPEKLHRNAHGSSRPSPGSSLALRDQVTTPEISCFRLEARTKEALHEIPHVSLTTLPESLLFSSGITSLAILTMPRSHFCEVCPSLIFVSFVQTLVRIKWDHLRPHEQVWQLFPLARKGPS